MGLARVEGGVNEARTLWLILMMLLQPHMCAVQMPLLDSWLLVGRQAAASGHWNTLVRRGSP
jgi:hypothetical protein